MSPKSVWSTQKVQNQSELDSKTLSQKKKHGRIRGLVEKRNGISRIGTMEDNRHWGAYNPNTLYSCIKASNKSIVYNN